MSKPRAIQIVLTNKDGYGFFSDTFRILIAKLLTDKSNLPFFLDDSDWLFSCEKGWGDYFTTLQGRTGLHPADIPLLTEELYNDQCLFTVAEYRQAMKDLYQLQPWLLDRVETTMKSLGLVTDEYAAIFIRRGDKCVSESVVIPTQAYVNQVLAHFPDVKTVFVQTDDFRAVEEVKALLGPEIKVVTTCPSDKLGAFVFAFHPEDGTDVPCQRNLDYLASYKALPHQRIVVDYSNEEMKEHVAEMLVGLELCKRGRGVALDYLSNTSRFLTFSHPKGREGVWNLEKHITFEEDQFIKCPRFFPFT